MNIVKTISKILDAINKWAGIISSYLAIPLMLIIVWEVITRKMGSPTIWGYETIVMVYGVYIMLVSGFGLLHDSLVKVDIMSSHWSEYTQHIVQLVMYIICFLPFVTLLIPSIWTSFFSDFVAGTRSWSSWGPVLWPAKLGMVVGWILLWLQGISEILKNVIYLVENKGQAKTHKNQVLEEGASK